MDKNPNTVYSFSTDTAETVVVDTPKSVLYECAYDLIYLNSFSDLEPESSVKADGSLIRGKLLPIFLYFLHPSTTVDVQKYLWITMFDSGKISLEYVLSHQLFDSTRSYSDSTVSLDSYSNAADIFSYTKKTYLVKVST